MVDGSSENCLHKKLLDSSKFSDEGAEFFSLLAAHSIGQHRQLLVEAFEAMDAAEYHSIWTNTSDTILNIISLVLENLQRSDVSVVENINAVKIAFSTILTSLSARGFNKADTSSFTIINKLLVASQELLCLTTDNEDVSLAAMKLAIARVVEQWWLQGMPQVESLVPQFLTYLMITALNVKGTVSDVKRILSVKEAFNLLELRNESSSFIRDLMLRSFLHPCFLKAPEGQRLLSFFLAIDKGI